MRTTRTIHAAAIMLALVGTVCLAPESCAASSAENAIQAAAKKNRYVFVTFHKKNDSASKTMLADIQSNKAKFSSRADFVSVDIDDKANRELIARCGADRSQVPLTVAIAPNGAITAGFPKQIKSAEMSDAFVSNGMAKTLKVLQDGKLAALCIQGPKTKNNKQSLAAAQGLKNHAQFRGAVEVVQISPSDGAESKILKMCGIAATAKEAEIVVIAPPGRMVGKFNGTTTTATMAASLAKSLGGGCSGGSCGPGGCN